jgi:beta-glucosidase-like glycosyl hydrolase
MLDTSGLGYRRHPLNMAGDSAPRHSRRLIHRRAARSHATGATTFPQGSVRGASWDPGPEERIGDVREREAPAHGANMIGAPCINLLRHLAWGRAQEGYDEESYHLGETGADCAAGPSLVADPGRPELHSATPKALCS